MAQVITIAGERLFALKAQNNEQLDIDTFIFANVPGQDPNAAIDRNEGLPPVGQQVHTQIVQQVGRVNDNVVIYSTVLDSLTGPFEFNWVGLYSSVNQTLIAISHIPTVQKTVTVPGAAGNTLNRNFGIEYSGIADLTGITVAPETWQLDYTARLNGMDELTRQLAADMNGKDWFIGDGFKVEPRATLNTFKVTPGAGYVSGLRVELAAEHILTLSSYPQFVYVDVWFDGTSGSQWKGQTAFTVTNTEMDDYVDITGKKHYVFKLAEITSAEEVTDLRNVEGIAQKVAKLDKSYSQRVRCSARQSANGEGWVFISDESHIPLGVDGLLVDGAGRLVVDYSDGAIKVGSFIAALDETFAGTGISVGASVGLSNAVITAFAPLSGRVSGAAAAGILRNEGLSAKFEQIVNVSAGTISVTHEAQSHTDGSGYPVLVSDYGLGAGGKLTITSTSKTGFDLQYKEPLKGVITNTGGIPAYTGQNVGVSVEFDEDHFLITHPDVSSSNKTINITDQSGGIPYAYRIGSDMNANSFKVYLYDMVTGALITAPPGSVRFSFDRVDIAPAVLPSVTFANIYRPNVKVSFNDIFHPSGNIWMMGDNDYSAA